MKKDPPIMFLNTSYQASRDFRPENSALFRLLLIMVAALLMPIFTVPVYAQLPEERPHIVMVVIDTLRADHLGCYGYERDTSPNIDALAQTAVRFDRCYSTSSWTLPAVASLLSGTYPIAHGATTWTSRIRDDVPWLLTQLQAAGYYTMGVSSNPFLTARHGFDRDFDLFDDQTVLAAAQWSFPLLESMHKALVLASTSATATRRAMELLNDAPQDRPLFLLVHYMDPHADFVPPPPWDTRFDPDYTGSITGHVQSENIGTDISERDLQRITALYDGEIAHVDHHVGQLLGHLAALGIRERTAIVLTADHGEELLDHGGWFHGHTLYEEVVRVPLIIDWPGRSDRGRHVQTPVSLVDVMPTILDLLGVAVPAGVHGRTLATALVGEPLPARPLLLETRLGSWLGAVVVGYDKAIAEIASGTGEITLEAVRRFDLQADARERRPLASDPAALQHMNQLLTGLLDRYQTTTDLARQVDFEKQQLQQLRALGYVGSEPRIRENQGDQP